MYSFFLQFPLEMLGFLMDCEAVSLQVPVGSGHVSVPSLVACDDDALSVCEVADSGILQRIELDRRRPLQRLPHLGEVVAEDTS